MKAKVTEAQVMAYIAGAAESIIEDDLNEGGDWTDAEHEELVERAMTWIHQQYQEGE